MVVFCHDCVTNIDGLIRPDLFVSSHQSHRADQAISPNLALSLSPFSRLKSGLLFGLMEWFYEPIIANLRELKSPSGFGVLPPAILIMPPSHPRDLAQAA